MEENVSGCFFSEHSVYFTYLHIFVNFTAVSCQFNQGVIFFFDVCPAERSDNFIVGLTNVSPLVTAPTLWNYTVCGQYPGAVGFGATVSLKCGCGLPAYRYLIVQFPSTPVANFCELEVYIRRKFILLVQLSYLSSEQGRMLVSK